MPSLKTKTFELEPLGILDMRYLADAKKKAAIDQTKYVQVFGDRHGFIENASIVDLLFNEGTNALSYLKKLNLSTL